MILGLRTVIYPVTDLAKAKSWYSEVFSAAPYFDEPFYVGYAVGGFELGLIPDGTPGSGGALPYWGVADIAAEFARIQGLGAEVHDAITDVGGGIKVASLKDPFGNLIGLIENPVFKLADVR
jgi:predicted enzyme related to lactoylglutathione lyase